MSAQSNEKAQVSAVLRVIQKTADKQGNVTMLRLAENIANDAALVRLAQEEAWDAAVAEAEACGLLNDAFADEMRGRNPHRPPDPSTPLTECALERVLPPAGGESND